MSTKLRVPQRRRCFIAGGIGVFLLIVMCSGIVVVAGRQHQKKQDDQWNDPESRGSTVANPIMLGDIAVWLDSADTRGTILVEESTNMISGSSREPELNIWIAIKNATQTKRLTYTGFRSKPHCSIEDNFGNAYPYMPTRVRFGEKVAGQGVGEVVLYPGKTVLDVLVFDKPLENFEFLKLELSGRPFESNETLRFKIPRSMVKK